MSKVNVLQVIDTKDDVVVQVIRAEDATDPRIAYLDRSFEWPDGSRFRVVRASPFANIVETRSALGPGYTTIAELEAELAAGLYKAVA